MEQGYKFRIYPTPAQEILIAKTLGCCRYVWNHYLDLRKEKYAADKKNMGYHACCKDLTSLKKNLPWLNEGERQGLFRGKLLPTHFQQLGCGLHTFYPDQVVPNILFTKKIHAAVPDQFFVKYGIVFTFGFC